MFTASLGWFCRVPKNLYEGGLQRDLFLPFIAQLEERCSIHDMNSTTDYRKRSHYRRGLWFAKRSYRCRTSGVQAFGFSAAHCRTSAVLAAPAIQSQAATCPNDLNLNMAAEGRHRHTASSAEDFCSFLAVCKNTGVDCLPYVDQAVILQQLYAGLHEVLIVRGSSCVHV